MIPGVAPIVAGASAVTCSVVHPPPILPGDGGEGGSGGGVVLPPGGGPILNPSGGGGGGGGGGGNPYTTPVFIRPLNLVYLPSTDATFPGTIGSSQPGGYYLYYSPVAVPTDTAGNATLQATLANGEAVPALNVSLTAGKYYSWVLWRDAAGVLHSDLLDDNYDPLATTGTLRLIQLFAANPAVVVTVNIGFSSQFPNGNAIAENLPYGSFTTVSGVRLPTDPDGADAGISFVGQPGVLSWNTEMYFGDSRQNTVFIIADPYGRFRPRVTRDGPLLQTET